MGQWCHIRIVAGLLSCCLLSFTQGQKTDVSKPKDPCSPWEVELRNQLVNGTTIVSRPDLQKISEKCIPSFSPMSNLTRVRELMKQLSSVYDSLNPGSRGAIFKWMEAVYTPKGSAESKGKDPKSFWVTPDVLSLLDRFLLQAPMSTIASIANSANSSLCYFYKSNTTLWSRLYDLTPAQAKSLSGGLMKCGVNVTDSKVIPSLGQLPCFFADMVEKMTPESQEALRNALHNCTRNVKDIYQKLLKSANLQNLTSDTLKGWGKMATGLNVAQIANLSASLVNQSLEALGKLKGWTVQQRRALAKKANVSDQELGKMGSLTAGLSVSVLRKCKGKDLLRALNSSDEAAASTKSMSLAQRKAIVSTVLKDGDVNTVLYQLPKNMVSEIPLGLLKTVNAIVAEDIMKNNPELSQPQVIALMKKVKLETLNSGKAISELKSGVRGLTCADISLLNVEALRALGNSTFTSPFQLTCAARQYFKLTNVKGDFSSLTLSELNKIPASYLLYLPSFKDLKTVPASLCPSVLVLLGQADIKLRGRSSPQRAELLNYIKSCLTINDTKSLSAEQAASLGSLVCTFGGAEITNLPTSIFQGTLSQFMSCGRFEGTAKDALRQKILSTFNATSNWTKDTLLQVGILAAVLTKEDLSLLPNTEDVKMALVDILASVVRPKQGFVPPDYDNTPQLKFLAEKLANIYSSPAPVAAAARKRRATDCSSPSPDADMINLLAESNVGWTPDQLSCLTDENFISAIDTLSKVKGFSTDQLTALKNRAMQVFGNPLPVDMVAALRRITLAFTESEVTGSFKGVDTDTLAEISNFPEWATTTYKSRSAIILKYYLSNGRTVASLGDTDIVALGYFLCVFSADEIKQINSTAYSGGAMQVGKLMCPDTAVMTEMKNKAVEVFGSPSTWTREVCQEVGTVAAGLTVADISQLPASVMPFLTPEAIAMIPPKVFSSLTPAQLMNLGPENLSIVSDQQRSSLSASQRDALMADPGSSVGTDSGSAHWMPMSAFTLVTLSLLVTL
ncbi:otoancorin-like [Ambystoma mexicanum]|uniref:otoancorin-like n=1 Tax=Ambystoma mexicanum TaxID=8296 RepID=UPI0037E71798